MWFMWFVNLYVTSDVINLLLLAASQQLHMYFPYNGNYTSVNIKKKNTLKLGNTTRYCLKIFHYTAALKFQYPFCIFKLFYL